VTDRFSARRSTADLRDEFTHWLEQFLDATSSSPEPGRRRDQCRTVERVRSSYL